METLNVSLQMQGREFPFSLSARPLGLGPAGTVTYYWMNGDAFRRRPPGPNFRACIDHWWAAMEMGGAADETDTRISRVWAECYSLVNTTRSLQDVYLDAHLSANVRRPHARTGRGDRSVGPDEPGVSLPAAEADRLRAVAHARDATRVRAELEELFLGPMPSPGDMPAFRRDAYAWIRDGLDALHGGGPAGLAAYVATLGRTIARLRKRGGDDRSRLFLNRFAYQSKVAFYLCYANAWIGLIPRLREHRGLDAAGERFLRLWHHQNQPGDDDTAGSGGDRDAFFGQVLSLHPLSAFVMNDPAHLQALGAWIAHPEHDRLVAHDRVGTCAAYWDLVATILIAAHEYRQARERWDQTRLSRAVAGGDRAAEPTRDVSAPPVATALEEYAAARQLVCPTCAGAARFAGHDPETVDDEGTSVAFRCPTCALTFRATVPFEDFRAWVRRGDD